MNSPEREALARAGDINLERHPDSPAAKALVAALLPLIIPHMARTRKLGGKGKATLERDLGVILAGVMREGWKGVPVRAQRSPSAPLWIGAPIGRDKFWAVADAMCRAGLLGVLVGTAAPPKAGGDGFGGFATALWPTDALQAVAMQHGATAATRKVDWRADCLLVSQAQEVSDGRLVFCRPLEGCCPPCMPAAEWTRIRVDLRVINECNARHVIKGAGHSTTLVRRFQHSPDFGGRFYPPVVTLPVEDRLRITMDGKCVVEIDVKGSQLTLLLGLWGHPTAPLDAYSGFPFDRELIKAWVVQCLGSGKPFTQWAGGSIGKASGFKAAEVGRAIVVRYPFFAELASLVPLSILATLPITKSAPDKMVGQWIVQREAAIISKAMGALARRGVPVLPVHDSLIVPADAEVIAKESLSVAFQSLAGIVPQLATKRGEESRQEAVRGGCR